jgi:hypothetical protein
MYENILSVKDPNAIEKKTIRAMIGIYCKSQHGGSGLCSDCRDLEKYALQRIDRCVFGADKPACKQCPVHCYKPSRREEIREVMRFSGPRMIYRHPVLSVHHLIREYRKVSRSEVVKF